MSQFLSCEVVEFVVANDVDAGDLLSDVRRDTRTKLVQRSRQTRSRRFVFAAESINEVTWGSTN